MPLDERLPASTWAIPLPANEDVPTSYDATKAQLTELGFVLAQEAQVPSWSAKYQPDAPPVRLSWWYHPAGAVASLQSVTGREGHPDTVGSFQLTLHRDTGIARDIGSLGVRSGGGGSSSFDSTPDGGYIAVNHCSVPDRTGVVQVLREAQERAPLLPFERWSRDDRFYSDTLRQLMGDTTDEGPSVAVREAWLSRIDSESLRELLRETLLPREEFLNRPRAFDYVPVEEILHYYAITTQASGQRFPAPEERAQMIEWCHWLRPEAPEHLPADIGPARLSTGVTLPGALVWGLHTPGVQSEGRRRGRNATSQPHPQRNPERLRQLLTQAPLEIVADWCRTPDSRGMTLPMQLLEVLISPRTHLEWSRGREDEAATLTGLLDLLLDRVGLDTLVWSTDTASIPGLLMGYHLDRNGVDATVRVTQARVRLDSVQPWLQAHGIDVLHQPLRVTLPVLNDEGDPDTVFVQLPQGWRVAELQLAWEGGGELQESHLTWLAMRHAEELAENMEAVMTEPAATKSRRPRL